MAPLIKSSNLDDRRFFDEERPDLEVAAERQLPGLATLQQLLSSLTVVLSERSILREEGVSFACLPSRWPETYFSNSTRQQPS